MGKINIVSAEKKSFPLIKEVFFISLLLFFLHYSALKFYLYWSIEWFDILMHFLGGFVVLLFVMSIFNRVNLFDFSNQNKITQFFIVVSITLIIGLIWELWEIFIGFTDQLTDAPDTILDVIMDLVGAITAFIYTKRKI
jgi:uncharacterized membrane protein YjjP (DUF1212 family)